MSILRIAIGVLIGACLLWCALALAVRFPRAAAACILWLFGAGLSCLVFQGVRRGVIHARRSRYERFSNPFAFWFYIVFYSLLGVLAFGCGVYCVMNPQLR
jgi:hypothetical protein